MEIVKNDKIMGKSCWIKPCVKNPQGEVVESKLWNDLYKLTGKDYDKTLRLYRIATNKKFIDTVMDSAEFDKNGQITARSFLKLSGRGESFNDILAKLNEIYSKENISIDDAIAEVERFNSEESYKEDYVPIITDSETNNDKVNLTIEDRISDNIISLQRKIEKNRIAKNVAKRLRELGVAYDFVGTSRYNGRFSTENAERMSDELYHLIEISDGKSPDETLIEEAAHLATVSMKDTDIINRLLNLLDSEDALSLFTQEELNSAKLNSKDGKLELAGILVKKALLNKKVFGFNNLMAKIKNTIYKVFSKGKLSDILSDRQKARLYAERIANGFIVGSDIDIEQIKENPGHTLYSLRLDRTTELLQNVLKELDSLTNTVDVSSREMYNTLLKKISPDYMLKNVNLENSGEADIAAILSAALSNMCNIFDQELRKLNEKSFDTKIKREDVNSILMVGELYEGMVSIEGLLQTYVSNSTEDDDEIAVSRVNEALKKLVKVATQDTVTNSILDYQQLITGLFFEELIGSDIYTESARNVMRPLKDIFKDISKKKKGESKNVEWAGWIGHVDKKSWTTKELASKYICDQPFKTFSRFSNFFRSQQNKEDVTTQIYDIAIRKSRVNAIRNYKDLLDELDKIEKFAKEKKINVERLYARYKDGSWTGNFIARYNRAQFELDQENIESELLELFIQAIKDVDGLEEFNTLTVKEKEAEFQKFIMSNPELQERIEDFEKSAYANRAAEILSDKYLDEEYDLLTEDELELLNKLQDLKERVDRTTLSERFEDDAALTLKEAEKLAELDTGKEKFSYPYKSHGVRDRLPQFTRTTIQKLTSRKQINKDLFNAAHNKTLNEDLTSESFGSPLTQTKISLMNDKFSYHADAIRRIPLYGINKLQDMRELSTDLFSSFATYIHMACIFHASQQVYPYLKIADASLNRRSGSDDVDYKAASQRAREELMNEFITPERRNKNFLSKIGHGLGFLLIFRLLKRSKLSGLKNWLGGLGVIATDTLSGLTPFSATSFAKATLKNMFLPRHVAANAITPLTINAEFDKYQKLINRWDSFRDPKARKKLSKNVFKRFGQIVVSTELSNYGLTDTSLISISYDSMMSEIKLYNLEGKKIKLNDFNGAAYNWVDGEPHLADDLIKDKKYIKLYSLIKNALNELDYLEDENSKNEVKLDITSENLYAIPTLIEYLKKSIFKDDKNVNIISIKNDKSGRVYKIAEFKNLLEKALNNIQFGEEDEFLLCNEVNDYICSQQGLYGAINANSVMSNAWLSMWGRLKGWFWAVLQRNFFSNPSISRKDRKESIYSCVGLMLASTILPGQKIMEVNKTAGDRWVYRMAIALSCLPMALYPFNRKMKGSITDAVDTFNNLPRYNSVPKDEIYYVEDEAAYYKQSSIRRQWVKQHDSQSNMLRTYLQRRGWSPNQLSAFAAGILGIWRILMMSALSYCVFYKGAIQAISRWMKKSPNTRKETQKPKHLKPGLLFQFGRCEIFDEKEYSEKLKEFKDYNKAGIFDQATYDKKYREWEKSGFLYHDSDGKYPIEVSSYDELPRYEDEYPDLKENTIYKIGDKYYKQDAKKRKVHDGRIEIGWKVYDWGQYEYESEDWENHKLGLELDSFLYDKYDPLYYLSGALYKLGRGVTSEAESFMNPKQIARDALELSLPIHITSGMSMLKNGYDAFVNKDLETFLEKELNYELKRFDLWEYDGTGAYVTIDGHILTINGKPITWRDFFESQQIIDNIEKQKTIR